VLSEVLLTCTEQLQGCDKEVQDGLADLEAGRSLGLQLDNFDGGLLCHLQAQPTIALGTLVIKLYVSQCRCSSKSSRPFPTKSSLCCCSAELHVHKGQRPTKSCF
jgi:hypothetical protein